MIAEMPKIVALRDPENPRRMAEMEVFEDSREGAKKAQQAAQRLAEEYPDEADFYMESVSSVKRFLQLKQVREWPDHIDVEPFQ